MPQETPTIKNRNGIVIKKACLSCERKHIDSVGQRFCDLHKKPVGKYDTCGNWLMSMSLERVGAGGGEIKPYEYFVEKGHIIPKDEESK